MTGPCLDFAAIIHGAKIVPENLSHTPLLTYAVVHAREAIFTAGPEMTHELVLYLWPGELSGDAVVHNEEFLLFRVGRPCGSKDTLRELSQS